MDNPTTMSEPNDLPLKDEFIKCPKCAHEFTFGLTAHLNRQHRMSFKLSPKPGELLSASTVGGTLAQMYKLFKSVGKDMGATTATSIERMAQEADGTLRFDLLITNAGSAVRENKAGAEAESVASPHLPKAPGDG